MTQRLYNCLACGSDNLSEWLDLGKHPKPNQYLVSVRPLDKTQLIVNFCKDCTHNQLKYLVPVEEMFEDYLYVSGTTKTLKEHYYQMVETCRDANYIREDSCILDVGCNDGTLAKEFKKYSRFVLGVDPAKNLQFERFNNCIPTVDAFFNKQTAAKISHRFHLITALNVLPHGPDPEGFLKAAKSLLNPWGRILIECVYLLDTLELLDFGQFYHEHISYFTVNSMRTLAARCGLVIESLDFFKDIHNGTIRFILVPKDREEFLPEAQENFMAQFTYKAEKTQWRLDREETYLGKLNAFDDNIGKVIEILEKSPDPRNIILYGASAKANTILNFKPRLKDLIWEVWDDNPKKVGLMTNTYLNIVAPHKIDEPCIFICGATNFLPEIKRRLQSLGQTGKIISYTPNVVIEDI